MNRKGFTLIELLIVIIILGILAALITGNFFTSLKKGRDAKRKGDLEQIQRALEMYYEDKRAYPVTVDFVSVNRFCETPACAGTEKIYMQKIPKDPTSGRSYEYVSTGVDYKLYTCLENNQQVLPYESSGYSMTCPECRNLEGNQVPCVWGVSSSNTSP